MFVEKKEKEVCYEKDVFHKNSSLNRFIKILNNSKRELQSNKYLLLK